MKFIFVTMFVFFLQSQQAIALGRLFITPDQRIQLEQKKTSKPVKEIQDEVEQISEEPQSIYLNGFVKPKHSASTIWVNGQVRSIRPKRNYYVRHWVSPSNQVSVDLKGKRAELSPGQTLDIDNNSVKEIYFTASENSEGLKKREEGGSEEHEKQKSTEKKKKPSVIQQAIELNKIMTNLPTQ